MPLSRLVKTSLIAIAAVLVAEPGLSSDERAERRQPAKKKDQGEWNVVLSDRQKKELATERKVENKKQQRKEIAAQKRKIKLDAEKREGEKVADPQPKLEEKLSELVDTKPAKIEKKQTEPKIEDFIPALAEMKEKEKQLAPSGKAKIEQVAPQVIDTKPTQAQAEVNRPSRKKNNKGWETVSVRRAPMPKKPPAVQPASQAQKAKPQQGKPRKEAPQNRMSRQDREWESYKGTMLDRVGKLNVSREFLTEVDNVLEAFKKQFTQDLIQLRFTEYLTLMLLTQSQKIETHVLAFRNMFWGSHAYALDDKVTKSNVVNGFLTSVKEADRPAAAAGLLTEVLSGGIHGIKVACLRYFNRFNSTFAMEVLEFLFGRAKNKMIKKSEFADAFNELIEMLMYDGQNERKFASARAHLKIITEVGKRRGADSININDYVNKDLAWKFFMEAEDVDLGRKGLAELFNATYRLGSSYRDRVKDYDQFFFLVLKVAMLGDIAFNSMKVCEELAEAVFTRGSFQIDIEALARARVILEYILDHKDMWSRHGFAVGPADVFKTLRTLRDEFGVDKSHWDEIFKDLIKLSPEDFKNGLRSRFDEMRRLPEAVRKELALELWGMFVPELVKDKNRRGNYFGHSGSGNQTDERYTPKLMQMLLEFPEAEMVRAFQVIKGILEDRELNAKSSVYFDGRHHDLSRRALVDAMSSGLNNYADKEMRLPALEAARVYCKVKSERFVVLSRYLTNYPYLQNDAWLASLLDTQRDVDLGLTGWYERCAEEVQAVVHDYWKAQLMKQPQNIDLARLILTTRNKLPATLLDLLTAAAFHKRREYMEKLHSDDREVAKNAARYVRDHYREFGILEETDELYQYALYIRDKTKNSKNPLNPYNVLVHHEKMAKEVVAYDDIRTPVVTPVEGGAGYYATGDVFKGMKVGQVTYAQLPKHSKTYIRDMKDRVLKKSPDSSQDLMGATVGGLLEHLLSTTGEPGEVVEMVNAKLIAIVAYLQGLNDEELVTGELTRQEQEFITFMTHSQACETNKTEVIHKFYVSIPIEFRLPQLRTVDDSSEEYIRKVFERPFMDLAENLFSCEKPFIRTLCGLEQGKVLPNASHIELFLKNLLFVDVPFNLKLRFDPYTRNCVPKIMLDYRRAGVLDLLFSKFIRVQDLADAAEVAINREMKTSKAPMIIRVQEYCESRGIKAELSYDDETQATTISKASVYELLYLLGFFKKVK